MLIAAVIPARISCAAPLKLGMPAAARGTGAIFALCATAAAAAWELARSEQANAQT